MNIYLLKRTNEVNYDEYDSFVCFADSEEEALTFDPSGNLNDILINEEESYPHWVAPDEVGLYVEIQKIGESLNEERKGVILASFNAG